MYGNQTAADFLLFPSAATMDTDQTAATSPFLPPAAVSHHLPSAALLQHYQHALSARILMDSPAGQHQSSSSCSSSPPPLPNTSSSSGLPGSGPMQRSLSSHSLAHELFLAAGRGGAEQCYVEDSSAAVRRVFSAGDLHQGQYYQHRSSSNGGSRGESPLSSESSVIIESMSRACKYTPEEKQQRIERYRTKRNHRNFNKKIKYECRKTLADSRPRIRGRFARNDEIITDHNSLDHVSGDDHHQYQYQYQYQDQIQEQQWSGRNQNYGEECYDAEEEDDDNYWVNFLNAANSFP